MQYHPTPQIGQTISSNYYNPAPPPGPPAQPMSQLIMDRIAAGQEQGQGWLGPHGSQLPSINQSLLQESHHQAMAQDAAQGVQQNYPPGWNGGHVSRDRANRADPSLTDPAESPYDPLTGGLADYQDWKRRKLRRFGSTQQVRWMWFYFTGGPAPREDGVSKSYNCPW
ncbi:hypothetical protein LTR65_002707 [Meristemomyces frigidus]